MTEMNQQLTPSVSSLSRLWERIPVIIRAIVVGFLVFAIVGSFVWTAILVSVPAPWSIVIMSIILWIYLKYFSGSWWPKATTELRRVRFRATKMPVGVWKWSLVAALLAVVVFQSGLVVAFRIIEFPAEAWALGYDFSDAPLWLAWLFILMAALVAGITEEVGFRGYMQVPLEKKYGAGVAITIVSLMFVVTHLNQAWAGGILIILLAISVLWGVLAYVSGSLIPVMISHTVTDIVNFSYWWTDVAGTFDKRPIGETGLDTHFFVWVAILVTSLALFALVTYKTQAARQNISLGVIA
jgi:membrane protease YdiL (CAAX protease family)